MALNHVEKLSKKNSQAKFVLGKMYLEGIGVEKNSKKAFKIFKGLSKTDANAVLYMAHMSAKSIGTKKNNNKSIKLYKKSADMGGLAANYTLKMCYSNGLLGQKIDSNLAEKYQSNTHDFYYNDYEKALGLENDAKQIFKNIYATNEETTQAKLMMVESIRLIRRTSQLGCVEAKMNLAIKCLKGEFMPTDYALAKKLVEECKNIGYKLSDYVMAYMYDFGKGYTTNDWNAYDSYKKALSCGIKEAKLPLLIAQLKGIGCSKNTKNAIKQLKLLAKQGNIEGEYLLYQCLRDGKYGLKRNTKKAKQMFQDILNQNYPPALFEAAYTFDSLNNGSDDVLAVEYYTKALNEGDIKAFSPLAVHYSKGLGVEMNKAVAEDLLQRAMLFNEPTSYYTLYDLYTSGDLINFLSESETINLLKKSTSLNYVLACEKLYNIYSKGEDGWMPNAKQAFIYKEKLALMGKKSYYREMSDAFTLGNELTMKDGEKAAYWTAKIISESSSKADIKVAKKRISAFSKDKEGIWGFKSKQKAK